MDGGTAAISQAFEPVELEQLGHASSPHYFRGGSFVVWCSGLLGGIFVTAPQRMADLEQVKSLFAPFVRSAPRRWLFMDARGFGVDGSVLEAALSWAPDILGAASKHVVRASVLLPDGWSSAWWVGALQLGVWGPVPARAFTDADDAWRWLEPPASLPAAVEALRETISSEPHLRAALEAKLRADPTLDIESVARGLRRSPRSLQRTLRAAGATFAGIRDRARAEVAAAMLLETDSKIAAVASRVGFRSRSHFVAWFCQLTGQTPGEFRRLRRAGQSD